MIITNFEKDWHNNTWRNRQVKKSRYKSKPFYNKTKTSRRLVFLKKNYSVTNIQNLKSFKRSLFSNWLFFHGSFFKKTSFKNNFFFDNFLHFDKKNSKNIFTKLEMFASFSNSFSFSTFLISFATGTLSALNFSSFINKRVSGWFFFSRLLFFSKSLAEHAFFNFYCSKVIVDAFKTYSRLFIFSVNNQQGLLLTKKPYWIISSIRQKLLFFSLSYLFSWKVLYGCSKKIWMSLSNSYCAFYFYRKDIVVFDASKTIQALKRSFYFLTSTVQKGSHVVFISWRFSDDFKNVFYKAVKECCQSASYGWFGGVLTNVKKLGLFANLYFKVSKENDNSLLAHEWLKIPRLFNSNIESFSPFYEDSPVSYEKGKVIFNSYSGLYRNLQISFLEFFFKLKTLVLNCINFFSSYSFVNIFSILYKNILKFSNNIALWFFFSNAEHYIGSFNKSGIFLFRKKKWRLITPKKRIPLVIKKKNFHIKFYSFRNLPNVFQKKSQAFKKVSKKKTSFLGGLYVSRFSASKNKKNFSLRRSRTLQFHSSRLRFNNNVFFIKTYKKRKPLFLINKFRPLKHTRNAFFSYTPKENKILRNFNLFKRFSPLNTRIRKFTLQYKRFKKRRYGSFKRKLRWRWRYLFKHSLAFFLFFKKNFRRWKKYRIKKKIKRWKLLKTKISRPRYLKFTNSFKKCFKKLFPTMALLLNSTNLSMAQNDVINLKMPSVGILNSSNINGYFTYSIPANDESEISSLFHLSVFKAAILKGYFLKKKLFFENL